MSLPLVERYRPKSRDDLVGNDVAINGLRLFLHRWSRSNKIKAAILIGPAGCGKTSSVYALANELDYAVTEVNASDTRKKSSMKEILAPATQYTSLTDQSTRRIILMDEIDGLSGRYDRGGLSEFIKLVKTSRYPIIGTANDPESNNIQKLARRKDIRIFEFSRLDEFEIFDLLLSIVDQEDMDVDEEFLEQIAERVSGDIRAAINELESHASGTSLIQIEDRDKMRTLVALLNDLYRAKDYQTARKVLSNAPSDYYKLLLFLFDETANQCKTPQEVAVAYEQLAQADIVYTRIMQTQNWSLLKYFFDYIGPGLTLARKNNYYKKIRQLPNIPSAFMARGRAKNVLSRALKVAPTVAPKLHISENQFVHKEYPFFEKIILGSKGSEIAAWLDLDDDQISALTKKRSSTDLETNIEEARVKIGRYRSQQGKGRKSSVLGLERYFMQSTDDDQEKEPDPSAVQEDQKDQQLSLDDFF